MKRLLSVITVLICLLSVSLGCVASADKLTTRFEPSLLNKMNYSAKAWTESSYTRAAFSFIAYMDFAVLFDSQDIPFILSPKVTRSYTGQNQHVLVTMLASIEDNKVLIITYDTKEKDCVYALIDMPADGIIGVEHSLSTTCPDGWYANKSTEMQEVYNTFLDMANK